MISVVRNFNGGQLISSLHLYPLYLVDPALDAAEYPGFLPGENGLMAHLSTTVSQARTCKC
jgi:hypothetical protein